MSRYLCIVVGLIFVSVSPLLAYKEYVKVVKASVNIRSEPSTRSVKVVSAKEGDIFELVGEEGKWYEIQLFSAGRRYLYKTLAKPVSYSPEVPEDVDIRRQLFQEWAEVGEKARSEAERRYPAEKSLERNLNHEQMLGDRYRLELLQRLGVQAPAYRRILIEGYQKGW